MDILDTKLETARSFGVTHLINASHEDPIKRVKDLTAGRGADYVFVTAGSAKAVAQGFDMIRKRGTCVLIGLLPGGETAPLPVTRMARTEGRVIGSCLGSSRLTVLVPQ